MKIYKISQEIKTGYDTWSAVIVCAKDEEEARRIHPCDSMDVDEEGFFGYAKGTGYTPRTEFERSGSGGWCDNIKDVKVEYLGKAMSLLKKGVILDSYHAG
jgi:hypothetical protein